MAFIDTIAPALELKNTACSLAHGEQLVKFISEEGVQTLAEGETDDVITEAEAVVMAFASKVARDASSIDQKDVAELKAQGYSDAEVFDIATTVAGRSFLTKILDALGVETDVTAMDMSKAFREALIVGRPISGDEVEVLDAG